MDVRNNLEKGVYKNRVPFSNATKNEYREEDRRIYDQFKKDLFEEFEVTDNPKAEKCFNLAWDYGHSNGYQEVYNHFIDLVELIK